MNDPLPGDADSGREGATRTNDALVARWESVRTALADTARSAGRDASTVALIAVSKTHPFSSIETLYERGQRDFGENYVQELVEKAELARTRGLGEIRWHFIGTLQTNKVKLLLPHIHLLHTLDRPSLLAELAKRAAPDGSVRALIEVNIDSEPSKGGIPPAQVAEFVGMLDSYRDRVAVEGWMAIPRAGDSESARASFSKVAALSSEYRGRVGRTLSMGMSSDFREAITAGANYIRVGTAIFGERPKPLPRLRDKKPATTSGLCRNTRR